MDKFFEAIVEFLKTTGIYQFFLEGGWMNLIMVILAIILLCLAVFKKVEPYLLLPISFGMLLVNLPLGDIFTKPLEVKYTVETFSQYLGISESLSNTIFANMNLGSSVGLKEIINHMFSNTSLYSEVTMPQWAKLQDVITNGNNYEGLLGVLYIGVKKGIYPCLIFLGIGATTDFGPLIANPKSMLLGAAAQIGIFITFIGALVLGKLIPSLGFGYAEASSIGIIGGADGPTAILVTTKLAEDLLPAISIAAYSYMALVPVIQPPIIRMLTTKEERKIKMEQLRPVTKTEKILFPILVTTVVVLLIPSCAPLIGMLMLGNLIKESGVVPNLVNAAGNFILYIVTILLGVCVGATAVGTTFLKLDTLMIIALGVVAFGFATASGVLFGKLMCKTSHGKVNPMIGAAGVSAVPMAARVVQLEGQKEDPSNFLLMHAMGPNVAGVIGSAIAAGILLTLFA